MRVFLGIILGLLLAALVMLARPVLLPFTGADLGASFGAYRPPPTPTEAPHIECQQGADLVIARHATLWGIVYQNVTGWQITCEQPTLSGLVPIALEWDYQGAHHEALYNVSVYGVVTAGNDTARRADTVANNGPAILGALGGL